KPVYLADVDIGVAASPIERACPEPPRGFDAGNGAVTVCRFLRLDVEADVAGTEAGQEIQHVGGVVGRGQGDNRQHVKGDHSVVELVDSFEYAVERLPAAPVYSLTVQRP